MQQVPGPRDAAANGAQRTAQPIGGLLVRQAVPVAKHHDGAVFLRQP